MSKGLALTFDIKTLESDPVSFDVAASPQDLLALSERFGLLNLSELSASGTISNQGGGRGVTVEGTIKADLVQQCIVTLEGVPEQVEGPFKLQLVDPEMADRMDEEEVYLDDEAPEYDALEGDTVDVGEVVAQTLSILMNPYPKAPGASVDLPNNPNVSLDAPELEKPNPFAALGKLKDKS
jgi:uncharacterized metal-binding protein YceD (DUF177 family)